jgi:hypothetical protein
LVGDHLLLQDFGPYVIIFMNACAVTTVTMIMLLRDFGPYGVIFDDVCVVTTVTMIMLLRDFGPYGVIFIMCVLLQPLP